MNRRKFLLGSAATLTGSGLLVGTQSSSRVEAQRTVTVQVEDDTDAYLKLDFSSGKSNKCEQDLQLTIGNQTKEDLNFLSVDFDSGHDFEVKEIQSESLTINGYTAELNGSFGLGEEVHVSITIECDELNERIMDSLSFSVEASGGVGVDGESTLIRAHDREIDVVCPSTCGGVESPLSWIAFCTDKDSGQYIISEGSNLSDSVEVDEEKIKFENDGQRVIWEDAISPGDVETVTYYGKSEAYKISDPGGKFTFGDGKKVNTQPGASGDGDIKPPSPCPSGQCGPKFNYSDTTFKFSYSSAHDDCPPDDISY